MATERQGTAELAACLTLVAPSGLTSADRTEWLRVARLTLTGIPGDLLARGCEAARRKCRFPSEIVPAILDEIELPLKWHQEAETRRLAPTLRLAPSPPKPEYVAADQIAKLIKQIGR